MTDHLFDNPTPLVDELRARGVAFPIGGFAPGLYSIVCRSCVRRFVGDKRSSICLPCAIAKGLAAAGEVEAARKEGQVVDKKPPSQPVENAKDRVAELEKAMRRMQLILLRTYGAAAEVAEIDAILDECSAKRSPPIATTMTLAMGQDGRPVIDGVPAMAVEEMPIFIATEKQIDAAIYQAVNSGIGWNTGGERVAAELGARRAISHLAGEVYGEELVS